MLAANVLCLKKKKKRTYCLSNANNYRGGFEAGCSKNERSRAGTVTMMQITEDTPPDMLAGAMDLTVHLPNGRTKKMSVERSTPMMDLLVQITVANQLQLSNYTLQALGMAPSSEHSDMVLPFKPNTPIGALDTQHVKVLPKGKSLPAPKYTAPGHQPFESTFRLKVHLPRNQLYVTRVSRNVLLEDIMRKVCEEKNLDPIKYEFKHPGNLDTILDPKLTLSDYQITEIYVVLKGTTNLNQAFSTADIMSLRKEEERKQMHNKTGGGVFNLIFKRGKSSMGSGSVSSENRSISPAHSDDSRSVTPPAIQPPPIVTLPKKDPPERPKPPQRKRRPAPKPPQIQVSVTSGIHSTDNNTTAGKELAQEPPNKKTSENGLTICHSRNSSDSSGYHEASILSDHCANASLPRSRPKSAFVGGDVSLQTTSNLSKMSVHSRSTTSLITGRRKKAAPPPPPLAISPASSVISQSEKPSPLVASQSDSTINTESIASTNLTSGQIHFDSLPHESSTPVKVPLEDKCLGSTDSGIAQDTHFEKEKESDDNIRLPSPPPSPILDDNSSDLILTNREQITGVEDIVPPSPYNKEPEAVQLFPAHHIPAEALPPPPPSQPSSLNVVKKAESSKSSHLEVDVDWQYQLPSPPKGFRDASPNRFINNNETQSVSDYKDSVVTSPELFEKLKSLEDSQSETTVHSEVTSIASEEPLNTLTLEHLEKRKSLVYNRELSTSLKMTDNLESKVKSTDNFISSSVQNLHNTYEDTKHTTNVQQKQSVSSLKSSTKTKQHNTLPNFKISTYDVPKQNITVFEDDTIRSSTHASSTMMKSQYGQSMENISYSKKTSNHEEKEYKFYKPTPTQPSTLSHVERSGSFSTDRLSTKPVSRSKSSLTLNKYQVHKKEAEPMSRSNSLFDVSGLQSLEVMKLIQNKLSTPTASIENISQREKPDLPKKPAVQLEIKREISREQTISESHSPKEEPTSPQPVKKYYYRGPPAVNMTTWSERPKIPVAVKEDEDYKLGNVNVSSKLIVNTTNNNVSSNNSVEIKTNGVDRISGDRFSNNNMNGTEQITQKSGNVVIKISGVNNNNNYSNKYDNRMNVERSYHRKTFTDIKTNDHYSRSNQRPHSIAFESGVDISRVPVITSVELKKSYKDIYNNNTTITHISGNDNFNHSYQNNNKYGDTYRDKFRSTENLRNIESESQRNVVRVKSFKPPEHQPLSPTVRGFRTNSTSEANKRFSWNPPASYSTLPHKPKQEKEYYTNQNVPFSQSNLRRTESSKMIKDAQNNEIENSSSVRLMKPSTVYHRSKPDIVPATPVAPPPPQMPKVALKKVSSMELRGQNSPTDARDMLLESIRNFGGKKGLRAVKA
ncbi:uncharacterized protein LOC143192952 isoform X5 [Rhynchophorus ferrugineus]|uniref:uncharacterized protein LOC143192952 isoform X5 n=2 Tax=Rhynchophorus ferrugineus TaxID=354439 RepID=UPI003FCD10CA